MRSSVAISLLSLALACSKANDTPATPPSATEPAAPADPAITANCEKLAAFTIAQLPEGRADPGLMVETCVVKSIERKQAHPGAFATEAACIDAAGALDDVLACATRGQVDDQTPFEDLPPDAMVRRICEKMAALAQDEPDFPPTAKEEMADIDRCVIEAREAYEQDPERFEEMAGCTMDAADMDGLMRCAMAVQRG